MALNKYKLGFLIEQCDARNDNLTYSLDDVKGISIQKCFIETKADMDGVSLRPYKLVDPDSFAYVTVTSRNGEKITLAHNVTNDTYIVSSSYIVFRVINKNVILPDYLFMYFNRPEFDRYSRFNSWGSARETFSWEDMCNIEIELPSVDIQQKYVDVYNAMLENQKNYERGLDDLKLVCDAYIEELRREINSEPIGKYICEIRNKNESNLSLKNRSVSNTKIFIDAKEAVVSGAETSNYLIVENMDFAYNTVTTRNADKISIALNKDGRCLVSPIYTVFRVVKEGLLPDYLFLWLQRSEYDRFARFESWGSAREVFSFATLSETKIPLPNINKQKSITYILNAFEERRSINEKLKSQIKNLCPILIKGSIDEAKRS